MRAAESPANAGLRFAHIPSRTTEPTGRAAIGSPRSQRLRSSDSAWAEA